MVKIRKAFCLKNKQDDYEEGYFDFMRKIIGELIF